MTMSSRNLIREHCHADKKDDVLAKRPRHLREEARAFESLQGRQKKFKNWGQMCSFPELKAGKAASSGRTKRGGRTRVKRPRGGMSEGTQVKKSGCLALRIRGSRTRPKEEGNQGANGEHKGERAGIGSPFPSGGRSTSEGVRSSHGLRGGQWPSGRAVDGAADPPKLSNVFPVKKRGGGGLQDLGNVAINIDIKSWEINERG